MRKGFTLIETVVALVLFQFAMLAIAAAAIVATRDLAAARRIDAARLMARNRVETLTAARCPPPGSFASLHEGDIREHWRVDSTAGIRAITDSVSYPLPRGGRAFTVLRSAVPCP